jgi:hypothetical protein
MTPDTTKPLDNTPASGPVRAFDTLEELEHALAPESIDSQGPIYLAEIAATARRAFSGASVDLDKALAAYEAGFAAFVAEWPEGSNHDRDAARKAGLRAAILSQRTTKEG